MPSRCCAQTIAKWHAKSATAVVLDPRTGAVLAMAQAPGYDANKATQGAVCAQRNRAVTDSYEPGSTFKLVTIAGALQTRSSRRRRSSRCRTRSTLPTARSTTPSCAAPRRSSVAQILSHSSNVGAVTIAERLGRTSSPTGSPRSVSARRPASTSPARARVRSCRPTSGRARRSATSRSGRASPSRRSRWRPPMRRSRTAASGCSRTSSTASAAASCTISSTCRIVTPAVDAALKTMLTGVVDEHGGTGSEAAIPGYTVAGKTGPRRSRGRTATRPGSTSPRSSGWCPCRTRACSCSSMVDEPTSTLRRRRRGARVRTDREVRPAVPLGAAGRAGALGFGRPR